MPEPNPRLISLLRSAENILVFTGAGISTASGIPDFRGPHGIWKTRRPVDYHDFMSSQEARVESWDFKLEAWEKFRSAQPSSTHEAIVTLEHAGKLLSVITQNIDGLHSKAGTSPEKLIEIHGTNAEIECQTCGERSKPERHFEYFVKTRQPPICHCGGYLKSATISFGQNLVKEDLDRAMNLATRTDLVVALGSTLGVYPAASLPLIATEREVPYVIINQGSTEHDQHPSVTLRLEGTVDDLFAPACIKACKF